MQLKMCANDIWFFVSFEINFDQIKIPCIEIGIVHNLNRLY